MTIAMPDSIFPELLPDGYPAYLAYVDGRWPTAAAVAARFPRAHILTLTVLGGTAKADGCDCESGDLTPPAAVQWVADQLAAGNDRPVLYASASTMNGGIVHALTSLAIRPKVRLLSAHYGQGPHICGPHTCGLVTIDMDGTQWTDAYNGDGGQVDMSMLNDDFFNPPPTWTETIVQALSIVKQGDTGARVKTVQGLCNARGGQGTPLVIDGVFGWRTQGAVEILQADAKITQDGIVGMETWPVLLGLTS